MQRPSHEWEVWNKERARRYQHKYGTPSDPQEYEKKRMLVGSSLVEGKSVLDVGCGMGHLYPWIKDNIDVYVGVDTSEAMLEKARQFNIGVRFQYGDVYDLSEFDTFDTVISISLLIHLPNIEKAIKEMWKHVDKALIFSFSVGRRHRLKKHPHPWGEGYLIIRYDPISAIHVIVEGLDDVEGTCLVKESYRNHFMKIKRNSR